MKKEGNERDPPGNMFDTLPNGVVVDILKRLSVQDIVRFSSVAKPWYSLITSKYFVSLHTQHKLAKNTDLRLVRTYTHNTRKENYSVHVDSDEFGEVKQFDFPFKSRYAYFLKVIGCINGVVCLSDDLIDLGCLAVTGPVDSGPIIVLWNPSIMKSVTLPRPNWLETNHVNLGFGFDSARNDYKVVRVCPQIDSDDEVLEIYELSTGSWRIVDCHGFDDFVHGDSQPVYLNGVVHWMGASYQMILSFDMASEVCGSIEVPSSLVDKLSEWNSRILVLQERLSLVHFSSKDGKYCVWVLEQYGKSDSWTQRVNFDCPERLGGAFGFMNSGDLILVETTSSGYAQFPDTKLVHYNLESYEVKDLGVFGSGNNYYVGDFVETIELLGIKGQSTNHANLVRTEAESSSTKRVKAGSEHQVDDDRGKSARQAMVEAEDVDPEEGKSAKQRLGSGLSFMKSCDIMLQESTSSSAQFPGAKLVSYDPESYGVKKPGVLGSGNAYNVNDFVETRELLDTKEQSVTHAKIEAGSEVLADEDGKSAKQAKIEEAESEDQADDEGRSADQTKVDGESSSESEDEVDVDEGKSAKRMKIGLPTASGF